MKKIADRVYTAEHNGTNWASAMPVVIEGDTSLILYDVGMDGAQQQQRWGNIHGTTLEQVLKLAGQIGKSPRHIFFSHYHGDHTWDSALYKHLFPSIEFHAHRNALESNGTMNGVPFEINHTYSRDTDLQVDGVKLRFISTPGHSQFGDDMSLFLPDRGIVLTGDIVQPHGQSYGQGNGNTFLPFYTLGDDYLASLRKIAGLNPWHVQTGHHDGYGMEGLQGNIRTVERTQELAFKLLRENAQIRANTSGNNHTLVEWITRTIGYERGVSPEAIDKRLDETNQNGQRYFDLHDVHGILYFIRKARQQFGLMSGETNLLY